MEKTNFSSGVDVFWWKPAAWLQVTGEDAAGFLQGQFTNDLRSIGAAAVYGLWLDRKGKVVADGFVMRGRAAGEFWVGSYFSAAAVIRERLENYIIADDVTVTDVTTEWEGVTVAGAAEGKLKAVLAESGFELPAQRGAKMEEWVFPMTRRGEVERELAGARILTAREMERRRIEASIPAVPSDIGATDLPNEAGLEAGAISYTKGCYLGQEVMARLKAMGQVRRRLLRVRGSGAVPAVPVALWQGGRSVGELRSVAAGEEGSGFVGLALCTLMHLKIEESLRLGGESGAEVRVETVSRDRAGGKTGSAGA